MFVRYRLLAELTTKRGDDFMGRVFYPLRSILTSGSGEEKTLTLFSHKKKKMYGTITLQLQINVGKEGMPLEVCVECVCVWGGWVGASDNVTVL